MSEDLIETGEAARILGKSKNWVTQLVRRGELAGEQRTVRGLPMWLLKRSDVEAFKEATKGRPKRGPQPGTKRDGRQDS